jgi:hypothetical protein
VGNNETSQSEEFFSGQEAKSGYPNYEAAESENHHENVPIF